MLSVVRRLFPAPAVFQELPGRWLLVILFAVLLGGPAFAGETPGRNTPLSPGPNVYAAFARRFASVRSPLTPVYHCQVVRAYPHDPGAFTEGLIFSRGSLFESTGLRGRSTLRKVNLQTGRIVREIFLPVRYFGEGLTCWHGRLIQLTWQSDTGFVYAQGSFRRLQKFAYAGQGWGLTHDARALIMSDGTADLQFLDPDSFKEIKRLTVRDHGIPIENLNELEYIDGNIFANVWLTDYIGIISPRTGDVKAWIDLRPLCRRVQREQPVGVLNGIAYDAVRHRIFVTGKLWPQLFEVKIPGY